MDIAYLILAHDKPAHLRELVAGLSTPDSHFYIHIDRKSRLADFSMPVDPRIHVLQNRVRVFWGDYSQVEATVLLMRAALAQPEQTHRRFVLLSGSDYPVRSNAFIHDFFHVHADMEFISLEAMPTGDGTKSLARLTTYQPRKTASRLVNRLIRSAQGIGLVPRQRDYLPVFGNLQPYAGWQWWALTRSAVAQILEFLDAHPAYADFYRNTVVPDESCFHTILGNSAFATKAQPCLTYADWSRRGPSPDYLGLTHTEFLIRNPSYSPSLDFPQGMPYLFARKFSESSRELLHLLKTSLDGPLEPHGVAACGCATSPYAEQALASQVL